MQSNRTYTESSVPDELGDNSERSGDTEKDSVEVLLVQAVARVFVSLDAGRSQFSLLSEEAARVGIDIGPWVCALR